MGKQWFIFKGGKQYGPMAAGELSRKAASGELQPEDYVRPGGQQEWFTASSVEGLFTSGIAECPPQTLPPPLPTVRGLTPAQPDPPSRMPVILALSGLAAILLMFVGLVVYQRYSRDTWWRDNRSMAIERLDEARKLVDSHNDDRCSKSTAS